LHESGMTGIELTGDFVLNLHIRKLLAAHAFCIDLETVCS
jgi:hypothetical protein